MRHERFFRPDPLFEEPIASGRGSGDRAPVSLFCEVRQSIRPWQRVRLTDISATGFRIGRFRESDLAAPLWVQIPGLALLQARIRWRDKSAIGCAFVTPLHIAVFEHIVLTADNQRLTAR